jgi:CRISPR-associated protein Cas1
MQLEASLPLRKNLWQQTIKQKIKNQAILLEHLGIDTQKMEHWASQVKSGDPGNHEARAAAFYWDNIFSTMDSFRRHRFGNPPNNLLNYGYAVLRAVIARSLVASGLLTAIGIHHKNKYNPYCLADDIMEPYRPFVDLRVLQIIKEDEEIDELTTSIKRKLLIIPAIDIVIDKKSSPLMVGAQRTTASLMKCFSGEAKKILYPDLLMNGDEL